MKREMVVLMPGCPGKRLEEMADYALSGRDYIKITSARAMAELDLKKKSLLFVIELGATGINSGLYEMLEVMARGGSDYYKGSVGSVLISSDNEFYTRSVARQVIFYANMAGCTFPGRPLVEATGSLNNFISYKRLHGRPYEEVCMMQCKALVTDLEDFVCNTRTSKILALHASNYKTSNTYLMWEMVKAHLNQEQIQEIHIENGSVKDCRGCSFKSCTHFAQQNNCFYGGLMVDQVYPAILECDVLVFLCPNYNDAISANMSAVINRITALFRNNDFSRKYFYSLIVSGHSGSDILAQQLISGLNINKRFILPPAFALMETANDIGAILNVPDMEKRAKAFAEHMIV